MQQCSKWGRGDHGPCPTTGPRWRAPGPAATMRAAMAPARELGIAVPRPFELPLVLRGHGWVSLPPHRWAGGAAPWHTLLRTDGAVLAASVVQAGRSLRVTLRGQRRPGAAQAHRAAHQLAHMLRLHCDLAPFWRLCAERPAFAWVARRGAGRLLRSATVFEDLMKLLFTTNCSWSLTRALTQNLIAAAGPPGPDGERAFPTARECDRGTAFFRDVVRAGYRSRAAAELAAGFASGALTDRQFLDPEQPTAALRARLQALRGFGPYAAGQAMRLLGRYPDLAIDSMVRATLARLLGRPRAPADRAIERRYRAFGEFAGLAAWCELTAGWHAEPREGMDGTEGTATGGTDGRNRRNGRKGRNGSAPRTARPERERA